MNRLIIAAVVLFVFAAAFVMLKTSTDSPSNLPKPDPSDLAASKLDPDAPHHTVEITSENFEQLVLKSDKPVLLDFWAPWCGPCVMLSPHVEKIAADYDGVAVIGKINVDEQPELGSQFKVMGIPLLVYMKNGETVERAVGFQKPEAITEVLDNLVEQ